MTGRRTKAMAFLFFFLPLLPLAAQERTPIEIDLLISVQSPVEIKRIESGTGFSAGAKLGYRVAEKWNVHFRLAYDYMYLEQPDVLDEWNWEYWEQTYVPFLPGITVDEINRTLRYDDGERAAVFEPEQRMKELRLAIGGQYLVDFSKTLQLSIGLDGGASNYSRELRMQEHWTRRYELTENDNGTTDTTRYDFNYDLLHFAPSHDGWRFFVAPSLGITYRLGEFVDLIGEGQYIQYLNGDTAGGLEEWLNIPEESEAFFPLDSKWLLSIGVRFRY